MAVPAARSLPWCPGPKLSPFRFEDGADRSLTFLGHLGSGLHSEVFKTRIQGRVYALKVFRFYRANELIAPSVLERGPMTVEEFLNQNDPFNCECPVYGRLKEVGREDRAVRCYGYLLLDSATETQLGFHDWNRENVFKQPLRCIVEELLPPETRVPPVTYDLLPRMRKDLQDLHAYGVVVWDLRSGNYLDGLIIDFSQAKTVPHFELSWDANPFSRTWGIDCCARDYAGFDGVIADWNEAHPDKMFWNRFLPSSHFGRRLRDRSRYELEIARPEGVKLDAIFYDWKNKQPWKAKIGVFPKISNRRDNTDEIEESYKQITIIKTPVKRRHLIEDSSKKRV